MHLPTSANPTDTTAAIAPRTSRERLAGATLEFLDAKSKNSAAALVGEGFRRLCERWGLGAADWDTPNGSVARALVEDSVAARLSAEVSSLLVEGYLARLREVSVEARHELDRAVIHLADWLDRFTPFRFVEAWANRSGPTPDFWAVYVTTIVDEATALEGDNSPADGSHRDADSIAHCLEALRRDSHVEPPRTLPWETIVRRVARVAAFAPIDVLHALVSRLTNTSVLREVAEAPRFTEPEILPRFLVASDPRSRAAALFALETFPNLAPTVARQVSRLAPTPDDSSTFCRDLLGALAETRGGVLALFMRGCTEASNGDNSALAFTTAMVERFVDEWKALGGSGPRAALVEWTVAAAVVARAANIDGLVRALRMNEVSAGGIEGFTRQTVRLALRLGEPRLAIVLAESLWPDRVASPASSASPSETPETLVAEEARRIGNGRQSSFVIDVEARGGRVTPTPMKPVSTGTSVDPAALQPARCFAAGAVRSRALDLLMLLTGIELFRFVGVSLLWLLGLRRDGRIQFQPREIRVSTRVSFLGREVRAHEVIIPNSSIRAVATSRTWRLLYLVVGLIAIAVLTLLGVSAIFDGVARQHAGIITFGALIVLTGLVIDGACYWLFLRGGERVFVRLTLSPPARAVRIWVDRKDADRTVSTLARLASGD